MGEGPLSPSKPTPERPPQRSGERPQLATFGPTSDATIPRASQASFDASDRKTPLPKPPKPLYNQRLCGRRIMAITLASQAPAR